MRRFLQTASIWIQYHLLFSIIGFLFLAQEFIDDSPNNISDDIWYFMKVLGTQCVAFLAIWLICSWLPPRKGNIVIPAVVFVYVASALFCTNLYVDDLGLVCYGSADTGPITTMFLHYESYATQHLTLNIPQYSALGCGHLTTAGAIRPYLSWVIIPFIYYLIISRLTWRKTAQNTWSIVPKRLQHRLQQL